MRRSIKLALAAVLCLWQSPAHAETFGQGFIPTGPSQQVSAGVSSGSVTLTGDPGYYVYVLNEGPGTAYVTCTAATATPPGGSGANSTPVSSGGWAILVQPLSLHACAAITSSSTAVVDFTPGNLF